jgi:hypothetical protein
MRKRKVMARGQRPLGLINQETTKRESPWLAFISLFAFVFLGLAALGDLFVVAAKKFLSFGRKTA